MKDISIDILPKSLGRWDNLLYVDFPAIKNWTIRAAQEVNTWILPASSDITLNIIDFDISFGVAFDFKRRTGEI